MSHSAIFLFIYFFFGGGGGGRGGAVLDSKIRYYNESQQTDNYGGTIIIKWPL